jgi:hypothetical protein
MRLLGPLREPFLQPVLADARAPGPASVTLGVAVANSWSVPTTLERGGRTVRAQMDGQLEVAQLSATLPFRLRRRGAARAEATLEVKLLRHRGGITDALIESWHRHGGFTNFGRERHPLDEVRLLLAEEGGATLADVRGAESGFGDVALRARAVLAEGPRGLGEAARWGVSAALALEAPTGSQRLLFGSGGWEAGAAVMGTYEVRRWLTVHGQAGVVRPSRLPGGFPLQPAALQATFEVSLAAEWRGFALVVEDRLATRAFASRGWTTVLEPPDTVPHTATFALLRPHNQITVGVRRGPFTLWFAEDFTPGTAPGGRWYYDSNGPDVALGLSLRR